MKSSDLADVIAKDHSIAKIDALKIVDGVFDVIGKAAALDRRGFTTGDLSPWFIQVG